MHGFPANVTAYFLFCLMASGCRLLLVCRYGGITAVLTFSHDAYHFNYGVVFWGGSSLMGNKTRMHPGPNAYWWWRLYDPADVVFPGCHVFTSQQQTVYSHAADTRRPYLPKPYSKHIVSIRYMSAIFVNIRDPIPSKIGIRTWTEFNEMLRSVGPWT